MSEAPDLVAVALWFVHERGFSVIPLDHPGGNVRNAVRIHTGDPLIKIDVRADGGYVVAPGSLHQSGAHYERVGSWPPVSELPAFEPAWLKPKKPASLSETFHAAGDQAVADLHGADHVVRRAAKHLAATPPAIEGQGGDTHTYQVCCCLVRGFALSDDDALALLRDWNQRCVPPWSDEELRAKMDGARKYGDEPIGGRLGVRLASEHAQDARQNAVVLDLEAADARRAAVPPFRLSTPDGSFVTEYVQYACTRTDAPPEAHELMAVGVLSALAGPTPRIPMATSVSGWRLVLWLCYIVNSTTGRKTTVIDLARDIVVATLSPQAVIEWEGSPQGLIQRLMARDGQSAVFVRDEYSGLLQQMNRGGHMAGLEQTFIRAYDGGVLENIRTRKREKETGQVFNDTDRVENPFLVKLTATTRDSFMQRATLDNVLNGFLARFVFSTGAATPRRVGRITEAMTTMRNHLVTRAIAFHERAATIGTIDVSDDVLDAFWHLEQAWAARAEQSTRPQAAGPALKRLAESVLKTAALLALERSENTTPQVSLDDFQAALAMGDRWIVSTLNVIEALGATGFQRDSDAVMDTVKKYPNGVLLSELYGRHRQLKKRDFDEILAALEMQELITRSQVKSEGRGRPGTVVRPGRRGAR